MGNGDACNGINNIPENEYNHSHLAPTQSESRDWNAYAYFSCWVGMNVCVPAYQMASSAISIGLSWWISLVLVALGNVIILIPILLNAEAGIKYGVPFPIQARAVFGIRGAHIPIVLRSIIGAAWTGILIWMGAESLHTTLALFWEPWTTFKYGEGICFFLFWALNIGVALGGANAFKWLEGLSTPILGILCVVFLLWGVISTNRAGFAVGEAITCLQMSGNINFWKTSLAFLVANISYYSTWAMNSSDLSRYAQNERAHRLGVSLGLPISMMLVAFLGIYITGVSKLLFGVPMWNPNDIILCVGNKWVALTAAFLILLATLSTNVTTNILPPANGLANLNPKMITYQHGVLVTGIIAIIIQPWEIATNPNSYIYYWLNVYGTLTGPFAGILICDYYIVKKRSITVEDLYINENSLYWYSNGFNIRGILAWGISIMPLIVSWFGVKIFNIQEYGWILSFILGVLIYYILVKIKFRR